MRFEAQVPAVSSVVIPGTTLTTPRTVDHFALCCPKFAHDLILGLHGVLAFALTTTSFQLRVEYRDREMSVFVHSCLLGLPSEMPACQASTSLGRSSCYDDCTSLLHTREDTRRLLCRRQLEHRSLVGIRQLNSASNTASLHHTRRASGKAGFAGGARCQQGDDNLQVGSPVMIVEAPPMLKTAEPMPMMRVNRGLIKEGDAGRYLDSASYPRPWSSLLRLFVHFGLDLCLID